MKARVVILAAVFAAALVVPTTVPAEAHIRCGGHHGLCRNEDVSVEFEDGSLVFTDEESNETVEITEHAKLFVNGQAVRLSHDQSRLVEEYHATFVAIVEEAKSIGLQGAKLGLKGAGLGLKAAVGVLMLLSPNYDADDLEEDLAGDEEEIERASSRLDARGERLQERVDRLERLHKDLRGHIDELDELGWF